MSVIFEWERPVYLAYYDEFGIGHYEQVAVEDTIYRINGKMVTPEEYNARFWGEYATVQLDLTSVEYGRC
jgi:hypothetical protein